MPDIGLHRSHAQIPPSRPLRHVREADTAGPSPLIDAFGERVLPELAR